MCVRLLRGSRFTVQLQLQRRWRRFPTERIRSNTNRRPPCCWPPSSSICSLWSTLRAGSPGRILLPKRPLLEKREASDEARTVRECPAGGHGGGTERRRAPTGKRLCGSSAEAQTAFKESLWRLQWVGSVYIIQAETHYLRATRLPAFESSGRKRVFLPRPWTDGVGLVRDKCEENVYLPTMW